MGFLFIGFLVSMTRQNQQGLKPPQHFIEKAGAEEMRHLARNACCACILRQVRTRKKNRYFFI
jgi:hypothetical protein